MTNVISPASRCAGVSVQSSAQSPAAIDGTTDGIARQQAIDNALYLALYYIRENEPPSNIHAATVKAVRAASMLKRACAESTHGGRA